MGPRTVLLCTMVFNEVGDTGVRTQTQGQQITKHKLSIAVPSPCWARPEACLLAQRSLSSVQWKPREASVLGNRAVKASIC